MSDRVPISVIILTYNEEKNIEKCLKSIYEWVSEILIVDSYSTDKTLELAKKYTDKIYQHTFEDYGKQRNWAQESLPIKHEWILHIDADERVTSELAEEIKNVLKDVPNNVNGFLIKKRTFFMGRWIKHGGHYPVYHLRLFRKKKGRCEDRKYDQHFICEGKILKLKNDIFEENNINISEWINRHNRWSSAEVEELLYISIEKTNKIKTKYFGTPIERRRWMRDEVYSCFPLFIRAFLYFFYRYIIKLGFLDGKEGLVFHFLQGLWYRFLIDTKIYEYKKRLCHNKKHNQY
ncbi:MAG: glycosyltransferase family 2 protein [Candidatus Atribacteria bacterium]